MNYDLMKIEIRKPKIRFLILKTFYRGNTTKDILGRVQISARGSMRLAAAFDLDDFSRCISIIFMKLFPLWENFYLTKNFFQLSLFFFLRLLSSFKKIFLTESPKISARMEPYSEKPTLKKSKSSKKIITGRNPTRLNII